MTRSVSSMDIATADQPSSTSCPVPQQSSADPRLSRAAQRPSIITAHPPVPRQTPTPAETPSFSCALEPVKQIAVQTPVLGASDRSSESGTPVDQHGPTLDHSHLVPVLLKFSELAALKALKEKERAALQDEGASINKRLEKAKSTSGIPVVIENIEAENSILQSKLRVLQQDIDSDEKTRQNMVESLRSFLRQTPVSCQALPLGGVGTNEKIAKLEAENEEMKAEMRELKELIKQSITGIPAGLQAQLSKLENSVNNQSMNNHGTSKRIRKLEEWKEGVQQGTFKPYPHAPELGQSQAPDLEPLRLDVREAHGKAAEAQKIAEALGDRISAFQREFQSVKQSLNEHTSSRQQVEKKITMVDQFLQQVPDVKLRLEAIEKEHFEFKVAVASVGEVKSKVKDLDTRYTALTDRYNGRISHLESPVRQPEANEKSASSPDHSQQTEALAGFKCRVETLEGSHRSLWNNVNKLILEIPQVAKSTEQVQKCLAVSDSLVAAIRSLEQRYSNITTEHLVKNMSQAMTELFPSTPQVQEQMKSLEKHLTGEIAALKAARQKAADLASLESKMNEFREEVAKKLHHVQTSMSDQGKSLAEQLEDIWELKNKFQTQSDAFSELGESIPQALQQVETMHALSLKVEAMSDSIQTLKASLGCHSIADTVAELSKHIEALTRDVHSLKTNPSAQEIVKKFDGISEKLTVLTGKYQLLDTRLKSQETAEWEELVELKADHGSLLEEFQSVRTRLESQDRPEKMAKVSEGLKNLSSDLSSLKTKFDEELGSLKARVDGLGRSEDLSRFKSEMLARIEKFQAMLQSGLNRTPATGDDANNRLISTPRGASASNGDHYRILGSATRNQTERGHAQNWSISHPAGEAAADSPGPFSDAVSEHENNSGDETDDSVSNEPASARADLPMKYRISENENGKAESRNQRAQYGTVSSDSDDKLSPQPAVAEIPMAYRITENENGHTETGSSRKRPRQGTFSDDGRRHRPAPPARLSSGTGSSNRVESILSKKATKKQEKKERKDQRKKQKQAFPT